MDSHVLLKNAMHVTDYQFPLFCIMLNMFPWFKEYFLHSCDWGKINEVCTQNNTSNMASLSCKVMGSGVLLVSHLLQNLTA